MVKKTAFLFLLSIALGQFANANDSSGTLAAGGITFTKNPAIQMANEALTISSGHVSVAYLFKNLTDKDVTTTIYFPLPPYADLGPGSPWDDEVAKENKVTTEGAPFVNFSVTVDGQAVHFDTKKQALLNGKDISAALIKAGIPLEPTLVNDGCFEDQCPDKSNAWQARAKQLGLLDKNGHALWQKQVVYYWTETFPAGKTISVKHEYTPATGYFLGSRGTYRKDFQDQFHINLADFDNHKSFVQWIKNFWATIGKDGQLPPYYYNVQYILTTGANWAGPIAHFKLNLNYPEKGAVAYNHFYGDDPATIMQTKGQVSIDLKDFTPKQDLNILFADTNV